MILFDNQHFTYLLQNIYTFFTFALKLYISLAYKLITNIMKATISTGQSKELLKAIITELSIEFMTLGFTQIEAVKMAKETVLNNYKLFSC